MRSGGEDGGKELTKSISLLMAVLMSFGTVFSLSPFIASNTIAPPLAGNLDIIFHDITPDTHTFPGDEVTLILLEMTASVENVQVKSVDFAVGGSVTPAGVDNVVLWGDSYSDVEGLWHMCDFASTVVSTPTFTVPQTGDLKECAGSPGRNFIVTTSKTRFIMANLSVSNLANVNETIQLTITAVNTNGIVSGGIGQTIAIQVMTVFFRDEMESGLNGWTVSGGDGGGSYPNGLWHQSSGENDCTNNWRVKRFDHSPSTSWWYGHRHEDPMNPGTFVCTYHTWNPGDPFDSTTNWGNLTSPWINASDMQELYISFWHLFWTEMIIGPDEGALWLYNGAWVEISRSDQTNEMWQRQYYNLSAYTGTNIKLEFRFDTIDRLNNFFLGWFIDDVTLYGQIGSGGKIAPRPPSLITAILSGAVHEDVRITWDLSVDDGSPFFGVDRYDVYRADVYDPDGIGYTIHDSVPNGTSEYLDVGAGEGDPSNHFYLICAVEVTGLSECSQDQAGKFTKALSQGMNLVSIPLVQWDESLSTVLQTVDFDEAWGYDSSGARWSWQMEYKPYNRGLLNLDHTMGFWIDVSRDSNLTVAGVVPMTTYIDLQPGWRLVGFPSFSTSFTVGDLKWLVYVEEAEGYDASAPPYYLTELVDAHSLEAGSGYWIRPVMASTWVVSNS
jgi:hypothetical protein